MSEPERNTPVDIFTPRWVDCAPWEFEHGVLYIIERDRLAIHLCACGCGSKTVVPFRAWKIKISPVWDYKREGDLVTFDPSISNARFCPKKAHYFIEQNRVRWA